VIVIYIVFNLRVEFLHITWLNFILQIDKVLEHVSKSDFLLLTFRGAHKFSIKNKCLKFLIGDFFFLISKTLLTPDPFDNA